MSILIRVGLAGVILGGAASTLFSQAAAAQFTAPALTLAQVEAVPASTTIVDVAASSGSFDTLVQALQTADLAEALAGEGPFTVFAPTDEAFTALPEGTVEALLQPENRDLLVDILTYHVVSGEVPASAVTPGMVPTLSEDALTIAVGETITVDGATVIQPDVSASNGIIHAIDAVLIPDSAIAALEARNQPAASTAVEPDLEPSTASTTVEPEVEPDPEPAAAPTAAEPDPEPPVRGLW